MTAIDRPVTVPTGKYAVVVDYRGDTYLRTGDVPEGDGDYAWNDGDCNDEYIEEVLNNGGRIVFEGEDE